MLIVSAHGGTDHAKFVALSETNHEEGWDWYFWPPEESEVPPGIRCRLAIIYGCKSAAPYGEELARQLGAEIYIGFATTQEGGVVDDHSNLLKFLGPNVTIQQAIRNFCDAASGRSADALVVHPPEAANWRLDDDH